MSQHPSLRAGSATGAKRNVLKRFERVDVLRKNGQWKDGNRVTMQQVAIQTWKDGKIIREDVRKHANGRPQNDDITLMVFGRSC